jgi:hypothetical protein
MTARHRRVSELVSADGIPHSAADDSNLRNGERAGDRCPK